MTITFTLSNVVEGEKILRSAHCVFLKKRGEKINLRIPKKIINFAEHNFFRILKK